MAHINQEQRYAITIMLQQSKPQKEIALAIGRSPSVLSREIRRNRDTKTGIYDSNLAQQAYEQRLMVKPKHRKLTDALLANVVDRIKDDLSPEQVVREVAKIGEGLSPAGWTSPSAQRWSTKRSARATGRSIRLSEGTTRGPSSP